MPASLLARYLCAGLLAAFWLPGTANAEQFKQLGAYQVHYIVVPTTFLQADVARKYGLLRGKNRALVNVSVLDEQGTPAPATVTGTSTNLLGQPQTLQFKEVKEGPAIYYLALLRHTDEENHRLNLRLLLPDGSSGEIEFRQQLYFEE